MNKTVFDKLADDTAVEQYTLHCGDISCEILTYGGTVKSLTEMRLMFCLALTA